MKTIEFKSNYAAFAYRMTAEVGEDLTEATTELCLQGIANICYRVVGSNVDKALGVKSKKNGGMGREAVVWDAELGNTIDKAVSTKLTELESEAGSKLKEAKLSFAVIGEHVKGEAQGATKEATALWEKIQSAVVLGADGKKDAAATDEKFHAALAKLGLDAEDYTDEQATAAIARKLREARAAAAAQAANALAL